MKCHDEQLTGCVSVKPGPDCRGGMGGAVTLPESSTRVRKCFALEVKRVSAES